MVLAHRLVTSWRVPGASTLANSSRTTTASSAGQPRPYHSGLHVGAAQPASTTRFSHSLVGMSLRQFAASQAPTSVRTASADGSHRIALLTLTSAPFSARRPGPGPLRAPVVRCDHGRSRRVPTASSVRGLSPGRATRSVRGLSPGDVRTFCRICEPSCGLVATVELGRLTALRADQDHPVTKGFACHKGIAALDVHDDPDRLSQPMRRAADGEWSTASWDDALGDIARRLEAIIAEHGPDAVAVYTGQPDGVQRARHQRRGDADRRRSAPGGRSTRAPRTAPTSSPRRRRCSAPPRSTRSPTSSTPTCASSSARTPGRRRPASGRSAT